MTRQRMIKVAGKVDHDDKVDEFPAGSSGPVTSPLNGGSGNEPTFGMENLGLKGAPPSCGGAGLKQGAVIRDLMCRDAEAVERTVDRRGDAVMDRQPEFPFQPGHQRGGR